MFVKSIRTHNLFCLIKLQNIEQNIKISFQNIEPKSNANQENLPFQIKKTKVDTQRHPPQCECIY